MRIPAPVLWHLRMFHAALRLFGCLALALGLGLAGWGIWLLLRPGATVLLQGGPSGPLAAKALIAATGTVLVAVGVALLRARPYRPDLERLGEVLDRVVAQAGTETGEIPKSGGNPESGEQQPRSP